MHIMHTMAWQRVHKMHAQSVPAPFTARTSEACHRPMTHRRLSAWARARARARCMWSVCSRLRLLRVQVRRVTDRWLTIAYWLNSMTNNVVSLFTAPFTAHTIVRHVTDQWLAIDKSTSSYPNEVFIIHAIRRGLDLKVRSTYYGKEHETALIWYQVCQNWWMERKAPSL